MNKTEFVQELAAKIDISKSAASNIVDAVINIMADALCEHHEVNLVGLGTFKVVERAARNGRNPQTGKAMKILASKVVKYKPAKKLRDTLNNKNKKSD